MKTISKTKIYKAPPVAVFDCLDDLGVTGMHMTKSSMPMMGGKLQLEFLSPHKKGLDTIYRWTGKVLWWSLDFTVQVTEWVQGKEKTWKTIGPASIILYSWFAMHLVVESAGEGSIARLSFMYEKPRGSFNRLLCLLLGSWYGRWCLDHMLADAGRQLENSFTGTHPALKEV